MILDTIVWNFCKGSDLFWITLINSQKTDEYFKEPSQTDFRYLANGKKDENVFDEYIQVFNDKHGFLNNLSILDLLFNEGRHAVDYLKKQTLIK